MELRKETGNKKLSSHAHGCTCESCCSAQRLIMYIHICRSFPAELELAPVELVSESCLGLVNQKVNVSIRRLIPGKEEDTGGFNDEDFCGILVNT